MLKILQNYLYDHLKCPMLIKIRLDLIQPKVEVSNSHPAVTTPVSSPN